jgi:hypothetical protein
MNGYIEPKIAVNMIMTPDGTILRSRNRHDFVSYVDTKNGETYAVDGGLEYLRRIGTGYTEMSLYTDDPHEELRKHVVWGTRGPNGDKPLSYIPIAEMSESHILACLNTQPYMNHAIRGVMENELAYRKSLQDAT